MPFSLGQIFGGWRRKDTIKKSLRETEGFSRRASRPGKTLGVGKILTPSVEEGLGRVKEISDRAVASKTKSEIAWNVIRSPHISEKATMLGEGRYVFKVVGNSAKPNIKKAVEERYGVLVDSVRVVNIPAKARRRGQIIGEKAGFKKAIITLKEGQTINEF